ncbi:MAG: S-layer homology domain-containing protein [Candidatus Heteroscillospira sp.]|jgi:hypothetical protein
MKRTLALVLALVMVIGMMAVPASADFTDDKEIKYVEAVDVVAAAGVINGFEDGSFDPDGTLTREQAAKVVAYMLLGEKNADALKATSAPFADVAANRWSAGYIAYVANEGIINGRDDKTFDPTGKVTAFEFAKLMLGALGYDGKIEQYVGSSWSINVGKTALDIGLFDGNEGADYNAPATREEAALYIFNTLTADIVDYDQRGTEIDLGNGIIISTGASKAEAVSNNKFDYRDVKDDQDDVMQFCEKYFDELELDSDSDDSFGRPSVKWTYDGDKVGTYAEEALAVYAGADFDEDTLDDDFEDWTGAATAEILYNGGDAGLTLDDLQDSRNGYTIEIYGDDDEEVIEKIVVTEAYVAEIDTINTDDDDEVTTVEVNVYEAVTNDTLVIDVDDDEDAYDLIAGYEEDDVLMLFLKPGWEDATDMDKTILAVADVESVEGEVTSSKLDSGNNGWIKVDGVKYEMAWEYSQVEVGTESEGTFYLYNGYVVHFDGTTDEDDEYAYVLRAGTEEDRWGKNTYFAEVVYADASTEVIEITKASYDALFEGETSNKTFVNAVVDYSYDEDDEIYTLTVKDNEPSADVTIEKGKTGVISGARANSKTVYVVIELEDDGDFDVATAYTGYRNVKSFTSDNVYVVAKDGVAEYVFAIFGDDVAADSDDLIYVVGDADAEPVDDKDLGTYYIYTAVVDGKVVEIMADKGSYDGLYDGCKISDDEIYNFTGYEATLNTDYMSVEGNFKRAADEVVTVENDNGDVLVALAYADDCTVFVIDDTADDTATTGSINRNYSDVTVLYTVDEDTDEVTSIYIIK